MPRKYLGSWEGKPAFRWRKDYKRQTYRVSCSELGLPEHLWTQEGSHAAFKAYWEHKLLGLNAEPIPAEKQAAISSVDRKIGWAASNNASEVAALKQTRSAILEQTEADEIHGDILPDEQVIRRNLELASMVGIVVPDGVDPQIIREIFGDKRIWDERFRSTKAVETVRTVRHQLDRFLSVLRRRQKPQTHREVRQYLQHLVTSDSSPLPEQMSIDAINAQTVTSHYLWITNQGYDSGRHNKYLGFFRRFINWLGTEELIRIPANLKVKDHRQAHETKAVRLFDGVKETIEALPEPQKCWALLALNTSMSQAVLGELTWDMIDLDKGILTRKRAKLKKQPRAPLVTYKLWPETLASLKRTEFRDGLVFRTSTGTAMYVCTEATEDEDETKKDMFSTQWNRLDPKPAIPLGKFRNIGATTLNKPDPKTKQAIHGQFVEHYLADVPSTTAEKFYAPKHEVPFFLALKFIRKEIFGK